MNIKSTLSPQLSPTVIRPQATQPEGHTEPQAPSNANDVFESAGSLQGPLSRAIYGAALYGLPAIAGATMGINGVLPGAVIGAGIGAATHLESAQQAGIFAATGAVVGGAAAYIGFLGAAYGFKMPAVAVAAAVGAGTQALFSITHQR